MFLKEQCQNIILRQLLAHLNSQLARAQRDWLVLKGTLSQEGLLNFNKEKKRVIDQKKLTIVKQLVKTHFLSVEEHHY